MSSSSSMESAIREAENLRDALKVASAIHAHSMSDQQKVSVNPEFPLELAGVLVDITRDAVTLHLGSESEGGSNNTALDFANLREKFACSLRKVLADMMVLQGTDDKSLYKLATTSDHFVLELVQTMSSIIKSNVSALGEDRSSTRLPPLNMLTPRIVHYLVHSLRCAAETHVTRTRDLMSCKEALLAAQEEATTIRREAQHRLDEQSALHRSALEKLEAQLAQATEEAAAAQEEIVRLQSELLSQKAAHAADTQEHARVHADVVAALQAEALLERLKVAAANQEQERLTTGYAELEVKNRELMQKLDERYKEPTAQMDEEEEEEEEEPVGQTALRIRVPALSSSRSLIAAGSKRTLEQVAEDAARTTGSGSVSCAERNSLYNGQSFLPSARAADLAKLPEVHPDLSASDGRPELFTRESIAAALGGNAKFNWHIYVAEPTQLSAKYDIRLYLCLTKLAWLPAGPGKHGFLHLDLDQKVTKTNAGDSSTDDDPRLHIFVGMGGGTPEFFQYYGMYRITHAERLSKEEWEALPAAPRWNVVEKMVSQKGRESGQRKEKTDIRDRLDSGEYLAPCMRLECVEFDAGFYKDLVEARRKKAEEESDARSVEKQVLSTPSKKRRTSGRADAD